MADVTEPTADELIERIDALTQIVIDLKKRVESVEERSSDDLSRRLSDLEERVGSVEGAAGRVDSRLTDVEQARGQAVELRVERNEGQGAYLFGAVVEGAFLPFASMKLGLVDDALRRAREQSEREQSEPPATPAAPQ